jgi:hypothetical protein
VERDRWISAVLNPVPFDGWSPAALSAAAADLGLDADALATLDGLEEDSADYWTARGEMAWN